MSSSRAGGGSGSAAIPANARKTVQSLREVVPNSEDEIYAMLKECNNDPDETAQRLMNQDPFHEVKRRRDKKKEGNREASDNRSRPANGGQGRGGRGGLMDRGSGRGSSLPRHTTNEFNGGRGKNFAPRENGNVNSRASSTYGGPSSSTMPSYNQQKAYPSGASNAAPASTASGSVTGHQNGGPGFPRPAAVSQGTWGASSSGHATMADIVKANGAPPPATPPPSTAPVGSPLPPSVSQQYFSSATSASPSVSSGVYSSSTDPVLHPSLDPRAIGTPGAIKREVGTVGNQRPKADWPSSSLNMDSVAASAVPSQSIQNPQTSNSPSVGSPSHEIDNQVTRSSSPPASVSLPVIQDRSASHPPPADTAAQPRQIAATSSSGSSGSRSVVGGPLRTAYQPQQHPVGTQKAVQEWKAKPAGSSSGNMGGVSTPAQSDSVRSSPPPVSAESSLLSAQTSKMQGLRIHDDQPVIIPNHLQVPEAELSHLSFGSFGAEFGTSLSADYSNEEKSNAQIAECIPVMDNAGEPSNTSSVTSPAPSALSQAYVHQPISVQEDNLVSSIDTAVVSMAPAPVQHAEVPKPDPIVHQGPQYPYLPTVPNYATGFNLMPQIPTGQYTFEPADTTPQDVTRLPSLMQYTDPTTSYYTPPFRPSSDGDARYPHFITSNAASKYNGNMGLINLAGQSLPSSQETVNTGMPSSVTTAQTSQTGNAQTVQTMQQQQPIPLHAYPGQPTGAPIGHHFGNVFGYQYLPPSFAYMHTHAPYQPNYTTNSGYPQAPAGNSYPPAAATSYPPAGAPTVKYQFSQYKPASVSGNAPHSATAQGYGGYAAPTGYAANPTVTAGSATGYDDVGVPQQYKDNLYIPNQQAEGSTVWIQTPLSRDMAAAGMQTNSYYNLGQQGQHTGYTHSQQPTHAHGHPGAYASLYHPSQSGPAPAAHQLLQQPQALGAQGAGGAQSGGYQQPQRTQQTWANY